MKETEQVLTYSSGRNTASKGNLSNISNYSKDLKSLYLIKASTRTRKLKLRYLKYTSRFKEGIYYFFAYDTMQSPPTSAAEYEWLVTSPLPHVHYPSNCLSYTNSNDDYEHYFTGLARCRYSSISNGVNLFSFPRSGTLSSYLIILSSVFCNGIFLRD